MLRLDPDEKLKLDEQYSVVLNSALTLPKTTIEIPTKSNVDNKFNDPSIIKNTAHVNSSNRYLDNVRFIKVNSFPAIQEHLTATINVGQAISYSVDESSLLRLYHDEKLKLNEQDSIVPNSALTSSKTIIEIPTKSYVYNLHESRKSRRDLSSVFNDQGNEFDNKKLTNLHSVTVNRNLTSDNELSNKKYVDDSIAEGTIVRFNQTLERYLQVSVRNDTYNITKYDKLQITDTTNFKYPITGGYIPQQWNIK